MLACLHGAANGLCESGVHASALLLLLPTVSYLL
jgi:hypothetical protein